MDEIDYFVVRAWMIVGWVALFFKSANGTFQSKSCGLRDCNIEFNNSTVKHDNTL